MTKLSDLDLVEIPAAEFEMGSDLDEVDACLTYWNSRLLTPEYAAVFRDWIMKEYPRHMVSTELFHIARFPVTNSEYRDFLVASGRPTPESVRSDAPDNHPVWGVEYADARAYADWIGARIARTCRVPTELEWECAARGKSRNEYPYGVEFDARKSNTIESGLGTTTPVDFYPDGASEHGVFDLAGNVEEWTGSFYLPYPGGRFIEDDISKCVGMRYRVLRGGSFALGGDLTRCARRHGPHPSPRFRYRGFRLVVP